MKIEIIISTIDAGIDKVSEILLPFRKDVTYLISHQYRNEKYLYIPRELHRKDVLVSQIQGQGLTKSRNHAIRLATGDICVIADDDVKYTNEYIDNIKNAYLKNNFDLICFKIYTGEGNPEYKSYPNTTIQINSLRDFRPSSIEITFIRKTIIDKNIYFDERFGMGSWLNGGGENLFVYDALNVGVKSGFVPDYIVNHPFESTIKSFPKYAKRRVRVSGALDARLNGFISIPKSFYYTIRNLPNLFKYKKNPFLFLFDRIEGAFYILKNRQRLPYN